MCASRVEKHALDYPSAQLPSRVGDLIINCPQREAAERCYNGELTAAAIGRYKYINMNRIRSGAGACTIISRNYVFCIYRVVSVIRAARKQKHTF